MVDRTGQQLGSYRLIRLLGRGGFAEVYLGEHTRLGTNAAIKVLYTQLASPNEVEGFEKEARTIAHLKHPHIVRVLDYDVRDDTPFLVMDYASNGTLRQRHPKGTILPFNTIISYVKQIAEALQYAHDQRLVHRDIKPENMLVGEHDEVLLGDFGIAIVAQSSRYESIQNMAGTMAYMAPEQIQGHPRPASDQYSLGIVIYEWLSGDRPFNGSLKEIVAQHLTVPPPPLPEKVSTILPEIEQVLMTALAKDPKQRFGNLQMFAIALEQAAKPEQAFGSATELHATTPISAVQRTKEVIPSNFLFTLPATPSKDVERPITPTDDSTFDTISTPPISELISTTELTPSLLIPTGISRAIPPTHPIETKPRSKIDAENNKVWHLGKRQLMAMFLSVFLIVCASALNGWYSAGNFTLFEVVMSIIFLVVTLTIPSFFGAIFGSTVGLFAGGMDIFIGLYVFAYVFNTRRGFDLSYSFQQYIHFFYPLNLGPLLSLLLIGLFAGLNLDKNKCYYNNIKAILQVDGYCVIAVLGSTLIGEVITAIFQLAGNSVPADTYWTFPLGEFIAMLLDLIILTILLLVYGKVIQPIVSKKGQLTPLHIISSKEDPKVSDESK